MFLFVFFRSFFRTFDGFLTKYLNNTEQIHKLQTLMIFVFSFHIVVLLTQNETKSIHKNETNTISHVPVHFVSYLKESFFGMFALYCFRRFLKK